MRGGGHNFCGSYVAGPASSLLRREEILQCQRLIFCHALKAPGQINDRERIRVGSRQSPNEARRKSSSSRWLQASLALQSITLDDCHGSGQTDESSADEDHSNGSWDQVTPDHNFISGGHEAQWCLRLIHFVCWLTFLVERSRFLGFLVLVLQVII